MSAETRQKCRIFVLKHSAGYDGSHDISHIDRVVENALRILSNSDVETKKVIQKDVLVAIASLHDSFDHKYFTTEDAVSEAKKEVGEFLMSELSYTNDLVELIISVIDSMGYTTEISKLAHNDLGALHLRYLYIVQDADRLDAIGAVGIARCLTFSGAFGRPIISATGATESEQRLKFNLGCLEPVVSKKSGSAIEHFYDKLVFLKDMLKTPAGRAIGEQRHKFILDFLDQFFNEIA
jgi:uncharacterized protein